MRPLQSPVSPSAQPATLHLVPRPTCNGTVLMVIREKSQFRAQHDSLSLSPAHDGTQSLSKLPSLGPPFPLGGLFFAPAFTRERVSAGHLLQSSSASRFTAGAAGFLNLSQYRVRPLTYGEPRRFDTIPSQPSLQAWR